MKIIRLTAENVMKLSVVEIVPSDNLILVTGENGAGKSSVLDSIVMALCGKTTIPDEPIKHGASKGKIVVDLDDYRIERSFTPGNSYLKIENKEGSLVKSPQKFLDELIGKVSFDPLQFMNEKPDVQNEIFLSLIGVDVKTLDAEEAVIREERTLIGRDLKKVESYIESHPYNADVHNAAEQSIGELSTLLTESLEYNQNWDRRALENETLKTKAAAHRERINEIEQEIERLRLESLECEETIIGLKSLYQVTREELLGNPKRDISELQERMINIESVNTRIRANKEHLEAVEEVRLLKGDYEAATEGIAELDKKRAQMLSSAPMPVPGLSYESGKITYNSIPLPQCSDGEKLMISLGISMALNPTLRVLRIKDGSLLDEKNRKIIYDRIKDADFQLWMESVSSDKSVGIFIEDGAVVAIDGETVKIPSLPTRSSKSRASKAKVLPEVNPNTDPAPTEAPAPAPPVPDDW